MASIGGMIYLLLYCLFSAVLAYYNFRLIKSNKRIFHALNGILHITAAGLITYYFSWQLGLAILLLVRVIFDTTLNILRSLGVGYMSPSPASIIDKAENWFVDKVTELVYKSKKFITDSDYEITAIGLRILILISGILLLIL